MKHTLTTLGALLATATPAVASSGPETGGTSLLVVFVLGFGALIVICQLIPALTLFLSALKALFRKTVAETRPATGR